MADTRPIEESQLRGASAQAVSCPASESGANYAQPRLHQAIVAGHPECAVAGGLTLPQRGSEEYAAAAAAFCAVSPFAVSVEGLVGDPLCGTAECLCASHPVRLRDHCAFVLAPFQKSLAASGDARSERWPGICNPDEQSRAQVPRLGKPELEE
eukprot:3544287-Rhodomonas_salina.1